MKSGEADKQEAEAQFVEGGTVLSDEFYEARVCDLEKRLRHKRFIHTKGVSSTAEELAKLYGVDARKARLAGLLHDWDKEFDDDEIRIRARRLALDLDPYVLETMPRLLHGPTAAAELARLYPALPQDVLQAIERHTAAAVGMSDLDMIVYSADALEPGRDFDGLVVLRDAMGKVTLEELFMMTFNHILLTLVERRRLLHPATVEVWNYYVARSRCATGEKGTA